ncbi:hypothetical protein BKA67DRAFT_544266 [Truncatella angustata]|uniref:Uncharacterized protein n=1 Tax=Truncatella angustata TaxID=152316 RepID=A0A9P9A2R4_9PEZI|nr:uncharacterized protein BKA67DRAFT_544266 [Truncatella angustata]KAH6659373.1 hypothetical protein BKA67DRAFT_544266 [Truncatella angustata]
MYNEYWPYFCNIYLRPWSRITLSDWLRDPLDKTANITFYHNHTTHDLADPTVSGDEEWHGWGERTGRREIAEALASDWVVPNIQIQSSSGNSWSTKFRMSALNQREGGPLDLRLSFPLFLHREELQSRYCLDSMNGWEEDPRDCRLISNPHSESEHHNPNWFDSRRWLSERHGEMTIAKREQRKTLRPLWHGCEDGDNTAEQALLEDEEEWLQPGSPHCICEMEQQLCLTTWQMNEILELKIWLKAHEGQGHEDWLTKLCLFEKSFQENFLAKRRDAPGHVALLRHVHPSLQHMDDCQGLESLDIDFFGDALSPGTAKEIHTTATSIFRDGLVERFTGREWRGRENLERPVSVFWDIGPHPEPNFTRWADPNHNMDGLNMDDRWR